MQLQCVGHDTLPWLISVSLDVVSVDAKRTAPRLWWLLVVLVFALAVFPPFGVWLWTFAPDGPLQFAALPMALQFDLSASIFGSALFVHTEEAGPLPTLAGWLVTIAMWAAIAVALWAFIRWLCVLRRGNI
jgi:hypothetical protein